MPELRARHDLHSPPQHGTAVSTLDGRKGRALLVVDLQHGVIEVVDQRDEIVATVVQLVSRPRDSQIPVVWVQSHDHELVGDTAAWR